MTSNNLNKNNKEYKNPRSIKEYRHFNKKGIIVMIFVLLIGAYFIKDSNGNNIYSKVFGTANHKAVHSSMTREQASQIKVLIDAGHGGFDNGATSSFVKKTESQLNLEVSQKLKEQLEEIGFKVDMTRTDNNALDSTKNGDMEKRKSIIYNSDADVLVSIHMNTHQDSKVNGPIVFYMPGSTNGNKLASIIQESMNSELKPKNPKSPQSQNFLVLRSGKMPGILVECGFITNKDEAGKLASDAYQKRMVQSISFGIMDYFAERA